MSFVVESVRVTAVPEVEVRVPVPAGWTVERRDSAPDLVAVMPAAEAGPFADNLVIGLEELDPDLPSSLEAIRALTRTQMHLTVPDLHVIDERPAEVDGHEAWFRALVYTAPGEISVVLRQVIVTAGDAVITASFTSFPFRDRTAAPLAEHVLRHLQVLVPNGEHIA